MSKKTLLPFHKQISHDIVAKIQSGEYKPGDKLPTESEICEKYHVSKAPVRQALTNLARENYIYTVKGKGSFVLSGSFAASLDKLESFSEIIRRMGFEPGARFMGKRLVKPNAEILHALNLTNNNDVLEVIRLRLIGDEIFSINYSYYSLEEFPQIINLDFACESLYEEFTKKLQGKISFAKASLLAVTADKDIAKALQIKPGSAVLLQNRSTLFLSNNKEVPIEYAKAFFVPDKYRFEFVMYR